MKSSGTNGAAAQITANAVGRVAQTNFLVRLDGAAYNIFIDLSAKGGSAAPSPS